MQNFYNKIIDIAKNLDRTIILVDVDDPRVAEAVKYINKHKICRLITVSSDKTIEGVQNINPSIYPEISQMGLDYYHLRKHKNISIQESHKIVQDPLIFGLMLLKQKQANGLVAGASIPTPDVIRPALQLFKSEHKASSFFLLDLHNQVFLFTDCSLNINPTPDTIAQIVNDSSNSFIKLTGNEPKVALLSYSTNCELSSDYCPLKMKHALKIINKEYPNIIVDGDIQVDAAINPIVAQLKSPQSPLKGQANILVFPDLASGNIGYKLVQQFTKCHAFGPILQGLESGIAINDLSRGCTVEDIIGTICITSIQSSL